MGGACCSNQSVDTENELHPEATLKGVTYSTKNIAMIIRV